MNIGQSPYGALVYGGILSAVESSELAPQLSDPTVMQIGGFLTSAYTIATSDGDVAAIAQASVSLALDISANLFAEIAPAVGEAIPLIGQMAGMVFAAMGAGMAIDAAREAKERAAAAAASRQLAIQSARYVPDGSGPGGAVLPADLWVQITTAPTVQATGRTPAAGVLLSALTEVLWPAPLLSMVNVTAPDVGIPAKVWQPMAQQLAPALTAAGQYAPSHNWHVDSFPQIASYAPVMRRLREAIVDQALPNRGGAESDGGVSIWPVYLDLLYALLYRKTYVWGLAPDVAEQGGFTAGPLIRRSLAAKCWAAGPDRAPPLARMMQQAEQGGFWQPATVEQKWVRARALAGRGNWNAALDGIYTMAENWNQTVRPLYFQDKLRLQAELASALPKIETIARAHLAAQNFTTAGRQSIGAALQRAVNARLVSDAQASQAARTANQGIGVASALALAALTTGAAIRWRL